MSIGIRELKANLSEHVARAAAGNEVVVTDRNKPVARLVPYAGASEVDRGIEEGWIDAPRRTRLSDVRPRRSNASTIEVLDEDRG